MIAFLCDICKREFTEKRNLTRHVKEQHGNLWSCHCCNQSFNQHDNFEMHQRECLFKTTGKRSGGHLEQGTTVKKLKDNVNRVGDALNGNVNEYRLHPRRKEGSRRICIPFESGKGSERTSMICFSLPMLIQINIVSSRTLISW